MALVEWDIEARETLRKLPKLISKRIYKKITKEIASHPDRYLETLVNANFFKIRIGDYRLFVNYDEKKDHLIIRSMSHRRNSYKW